MLAYKLVLFSIVYSLYDVTCSKILTVNVDDSRAPCTKFIPHAVNESLSYKVKCTQSAPHELCQLAFFGLGSDYLDRYKVCIHPVLYNVSDCSSSMVYDFTTLMTVQKRDIFNCSHLPHDLCAEEGQYVVISFTSGTHYSSFELEVTATKTYDNSPMSDDKNISHGGVTAGIVGGIVAISVVFLLAVIAVCNWRIRGSPTACSPQKKPRNGFV